LPFIVNLNLSALCARPVNSGVRHARKQRPKASRNNLLSARVAAKRRSNMPMHPTGNSLPLIVNLSHDAVVSRRVIGGVRHAWMQRHETGIMTMPSVMPLPRGGLTTHSTRAELARMSFARLKARYNLSRRVNSALGTPGSCDMRQSEVICRVACRNQEAV
jgi:hypothetical protein